MTSDQPASSAGSLVGRVALITGAGVGIGRETALAISAAGAYVGVHFNQSQAEAEQTLADLRAAKECSCRET